MRRAILAVCGTAVATTLLIGAKSASAPTDHGTAVGPATQTAEPGIAATIAASATAHPATTTGPRTPAPTKPGTKPTSPAPTRAGTTTSPAPAGGRYTDGTYAGSSATYKYGTIKVTITVSGGWITQATATYPTSGQSGVINGKAIPKLNQETLQAQNADIDTVSGATLTSEAYQNSLQAAVDRARS
jgi:uncharacterized protein with FMN-binding domain